MTTPTNLDDFGIDPERIEAGAIMRLANKVLEGDNGAAAALMEVMKPARDRRVVQSHRERLDDLKGGEDWVGLARYLGEYGENESGLALFLGRTPSEEERAAFELGRRHRQLEVRVLQLERLRRAGGGVMKWMEA